ncbi:hypothetical protein [Herbaspirillum seropedicae]|uniref:hypothetical protein n=1 Tax=Herbaspirillum seropedicae TaxID=964 RepID=UPI003FCE80E8
MEMLKDFAASLSDWIKTRAVNPFLGAFTFFWLAINWRIVLVLVSDDHYEKKISAVDRYLDASGIGRYGGLLILPTLLALLYVFVGQFIFGLVTIYHRRRQNSIKIQLMRVDRDRPVTREEKLNLIRGQGRLTAKITELEEELDRTVQGHSVAMGEQAKKLQAYEKMILDQATAVAFEPKSAAIESKPPTAVMNVDYVKANLPEFSPLPLGKSRFTSLPQEMLFRIKDTTLSSEQIALLRLLYEADGMPLSLVQLRKQYEISHISMTNLCTSLEEIYLVDTDDSPGEIKLTTFGYEVAEFVYRNALRVS